MPSPAGKPLESLRSPLGALLPPFRLVTRREGGRCRSLPPCAEDIISGKVEQGTGPGYMATPWTARCGPRKARTCSPPPLWEGGVSQASAEKHSPGTHPQSELVERFRDLTSQHEAGLNCLLADLRFPRGTIRHSPVLKDRVETLAGFQRLDQRFRLVLKLGTKVRHLT